jgi:hypothetical protein
MRVLDIAMSMMLLVFAASVHADCPRPPPVQENTSPDGRLSVRIITGEGWGRRSTEVQHATAEWYRFGGGDPKKIRTTTLVNRFAPYLFKFNNDGALITLEDWCGGGNGSNVVVIYSSSGNVVKKYALTDLYSSTKRHRFWETGEGTEWLCSDSSLELRSLREATVDDAIGGRFVFDLVTGAFRYEPDVTTCENK